MATLSDDEKRAIAGRARTLQERLDRPFPAAADTADDLGEQLDEYVEEWREEVADGDEETFRRRFDREGLDVETARRRLAGNRWPDDEPLPDWVDELDEVLSFVVASRPVDPGFDLDGEVAFEGLLVPFVEYARTSLDGDVTGRVSATVVDDLSARLAGRLVHLCSRPLFVDFKTHLADHDPDLVFDDVEIPAGQTEFYDEFTGQLLSGGFGSFFGEYAFLGRLVVATLRDWTANVEEFCRRVAADRDAIAATFGDGGGDGLGEITTVAAVGDPHQRGREVLGVAFESGVRVAYKPRNTGIVTGFYDVLDWINEHGDLPHLRTLAFVGRDDYAWMEWVESRPCDDADQVVAYYRRAGMLMGLFYAFDATDLHFENIVAVGEQPVSIDLETLAQPMVTADKRQINETVRVVADTAIRTGAVPRAAPREQFEDTAGFSGPDVEVTEPVDRFRDANTDRMELERVPRVEAEGGHLPELDGTVTSPYDHVEAILEGFEEMHEFVDDREAALLADDGPIAALVDRESRVRALYRNTLTYGQILDAIRKASNLRSGLQFGLRSETLARLVVAGDVSESVWPLVDAERAVLRRGNVPRFSAKLDSVAVFDRDDLVVEEFFEQRPVDQIRDRVRSFDASDRREQLNYVRWSYGLYDDPHSPGEETEIDEFGVPPATGGATGGADTSEGIESLAEDAAVAVYDRLVENAREEDGHPTWIRRQILPGEGLDVRGVRDDLYAGRVGVGVFLAGLARVLGDDRYRSSAHDVVAPVLDDLDEGTFRNDAGSFREPPREVGGVAGLGSIVYGLVRTSTLLSDDRYLGPAREVAAMLDADRIAGDDRYDVLHGSAGAILGLLALHDADGDGDAVDRATRAGEHLLDGTADGTDAPAWTLPEYDRPLCGFSHGVAGVAYALSRLGEATGKRRFSTAAVESLAYERRRFDASVGNWPDLRSDSAAEWVDAWCHGRTGVGLGRLGMADVLDGGGETPVDGVAPVRNDAERALSGLDPSLLPADDHVCCGTFGRVELLLAAGRRLEEPAYRRQAERLATASVRRADERGQFSTEWQTEHWYNPAFFDGEAGVGYTLLRLVDGSLPSVLLLE